MLFAGDNVEVQPTPGGPWLTATVVEADATVAAVWCPSLGMRLHFGHDSPEIRKMKIGEHHRACLLCASALHGTVVGRKTRHGHECIRVACDVCGLVQHIAPPTAAELSAYYEREYRVEHGVLPMLNDGVTIYPEDPRYPAVLDRRAANQATAISESLGVAAGAHLVEIGCGDGRIAAAMQSKGYRVLGIEPDIAMRETASGRGVEVARDFDLGDEHFEPRLFDGAYMIHSLEHMRDPLRTLRFVRQVTKPSGWIYVEVPDVFNPYGGLEDWFFQWPHVVDFSAPTLIASLLAAGWVDVGAQQVGNVLVARARRPFEPSLATTDAALDDAGARGSEAVVASLRAYERRTRLEGAYRAFLGGRDDGLDDLRAAISEILQEGAEAYDVLTKLQATLLKVAALEGAEEPSAEDDLEGRGYAAGWAAAALSYSQVVGHVLNASKSWEVFR